MCGWGLFTVGAMLFFFECWRAARARSVPAHRDLQTLANALFVLAGAFFVPGCWFFFARATRVGGAVMFLFSSLISGSAGALLVGDSVRVNEGYLVLGDRLTLGSLFLVCSSVFYFLGSCFWMKTSQYTVAAAASCVAACLATAGSGLFVTVMASPTYTGMLGETAGLTSNPAVGASYAPTRVSMPAPEPMTKQDVEDNPFL